MSTPKFGRYVIKAELGRGGMATVFHAYDPSFERDVAIKVLPPGFLHDPHLRTRFEREAKMIASLEHPSIVPVYDIGDQEGQPYIVMRYMSGGSLSERLARGALPLDEASRIVSRLARALDAAHSRGIIHRDLKPGNVLFDQYGNAFLSDFGIARLSQQDGATLTGSAIIGTPAYMSPEQVQGDKEIDQRSDIYALGVMIYQMLTGDLPFRAETPARVMLMHILEPVPNILDSKIDLPAGSDPIIRRAMAKEPDERYATSSELSGDLEKVARNQDLTSILQPEPLDHDTLISSATIEAFPIAADQAPQLGETLDARPETIPLPEKPAYQKRLLLLVGAMAAFILVIAGGYLVWGPNSRFRQENANNPSTQGSSMEIPVGVQPESGTVIPLVEVAIASTKASQTAAAQSTEAASSAVALAKITSVVRTSLARLTLSARSTKTQIALSKFPQGKIVFTCQIFKDSQRNQVCMINADGSGWERLSSDDSADYTYPAFSPDGQSIVVALEKSHDHQIYEIDLNGKQRQLTDLPFGAYAPAVSPDNQWIVFTANDGSHQTLWLMDRNGVNPKALTYGSDGDAWDATWSPDSKQIIFASSRVGGIQFYVTDIKGANVRQLTQIEGLRGRSDWSPDGQMIATYMGEQWHREIYFINLDGSIARQVTEGGNNLAPYFSPDGQWVVFTSYRDRYGDNNGCEIYIMRLDGNEVSRLTENDYCDWQPNWGP